MNIITRKEALEKRLTHYFTGKPCKRGHISERLVSGRGCMECYKVNSKSWYEKNPEYKKNWYKENFEYKNEYDKNWRKENPDKTAAQWQKYQTAKINRIPLWVDLKEIEKIYLKASYLTKEIGVQYDVDHIIPLQGKKVSGLHIESNLQVITHVANMKKGNRFEI